MSPSLSVEQKALVKILDNTRSTYVFFGKKVLLVEGDTDRYFFKAALNELSSSASQEISVLDVGGKGGLKTWKEFFESFGLTVYFVGDFDNVFSLLKDGKPLVEQKVRDHAEDSLKQGNLDNLSEQQRGSFKVLYEKLIADDNFLSKPKRGLWKPFIDMFIKFAQVSKLSVVQKVIADNAMIAAEIERLYAERIFILKKGDLEYYLGLSNKGLAGVIDFCEVKLKTFVTDGHSEESKEIGKILDQVLK